MSDIWPNSNQHASTIQYVMVFFTALFIKGIYNVVMHLQHDSFSPFWSLEGFDLVKKEVVYGTVTDFQVIET
jgi:hypothetical protein